MEFSMNYSSGIPIPPLQIGKTMFDELTEMRLENEKCLERYGFKVYSQNEEDGIIEEIFRRIGTTNKTFVEFGVENGLESNCHYLLFSGWHGLWMDGDTAHVNEIHNIFHPVLKTGQLRCKNCFITKDNINALIAEGGISGDIDLLSIDVDGNDYYVWNAINVVNPRVVIIEYNAKFPPNCDWKMAYNEYHLWDGSDWMGASLKALELLGRKKGYQLVGTNITGSNAFFVKDELAQDKFLEPATAENLYNPMRFRQLHFPGEHPARYCLVGQEPNLGILNYLPDAIAAPIFGFHEPKTENGKTVATMSNKNSALVVRTVRDKHRLSIPYSFPQKALVAFPSLHVIIQINESAWRHTVQANGQIIVDVPLAQDANAIHVTLSLSHLWSSENSTDTSLIQGISIPLDEIQWS